MKIAILSSTFFPRMGGAEIMMHNLGTALVNAGHEVHMIVPGSEKLSEFHPSYTLSPLIIPKGSVKFNVLEFVMAMNLVYLQRKHSFDVLQVFVTYPPGYAAMLAKKLLKIPVVISATGKDIQVMPEIGYGLRLDQKMDQKIRKAVSNADAVVTISKAMTDAYVDAGVNDESITFIPNGIWYEKFQENYSHREQIRKKIRTELQIPDDATMLLCTARNHPKKNYPTLIKAVTLLHQRGMKPHLVIAGAETEKLESLVTENNLHDYIHLLGSYPKHFGRFDQLPPQELVELYVASDMFVFPSLIESFGIVLIEAMAAGLPIVAGKVEGVNEVVNDEHDGVLIDDPLDAEQLAYAISRVVSDQQLKDKLTQNGLLTSKKYDWINVVKDFEKLYNQLRK